MLLSTVAPEAAKRARLAAEVASDKGAEDTIVLDVGEIIGIADLFVITSGTNTRQVRTIVDEIERRLETDLEARPRSVEGLADLGWVLLDFGDVIVHVFGKESRAFYDLDRLWADAARLDWQEPSAAVS